MTIDLGKVAITAGGNWKNNVTYEALTLVVFAALDGGDGCGYISLKNNLRVTPGTDETTWKKAAEAGQSIYTLCVAHGTFVGTEEEFVAAYNDAVTAATNAASAANSAATYARNTADTAAAEATATAARAAQAAEATAAAAASQAQQTANEAAAEAREVSDAMVVRMETFDENEEARQSHEEDRQEAETARETAEEARASAETARETASAEATAAANAAAAVAEEKAGDANTAAAAANAAAADAEAATEQLEQLTTGLIGLKVEDGELILVQNAQTGVAQTGSIDDDGMVTIEFTV